MKLDQKVIPKRGALPRYRLANGLQLIPNERGATILSLHPLHIWQINPMGACLLERLSSGSTHHNPHGKIERLPNSTTPKMHEDYSADELVEDMAHITLVDAIAFLEDLTRRRLLVKEAAQRLPSEEWPFVSVILPSRDRPVETRECIKSLLSLDYPADRYEIIIVDDASDPPLRLTLDGCLIRILRQDENIGQSAARNLAVAEAQGEILAFIDNDCVACSDWLRILVSYLLGDAALGIIGGQVITPLAKGDLSAFEHVRSPLSMGPFAEQVTPRGRVPYLPSCNLVVRREVYERLGGFSVDMKVGEDVDFIWRAQRAGEEALYVPDGTVFHRPQVRLGRLMMRRSDYGSSEADLERRHPQNRKVILTPLIGLSLIIGAAAWPTNRVLGSVLLSSAILGTLIKFIQSWSRLRRIGLSIPIRWIWAAVLRGILAGLYHLSLSVARYYSLLLLVVGIFLPWILPAVFILLLIAAVSDYCGLSPHLSLPKFITLYWLEMLAYQMGVWRGCLKFRTLRPLLPKFDFKI